jgi:hypothetical protein
VDLWAAGEPNNFQLAPGQVTTRDVCIPSRLVGMTTTVPGSTSLPVSWVSWPDDFGGHFY